MLIEKDKLQKAKEKIGNEAASIIADLMDLEEYDEKNKKALCPFHNEDTPSFVWNAKGLFYHCFGCGKNISIVDAYMHCGLTFVEACVKVFELANIPYAFGEHKIKTKSQYRYPHEEKGTNKEQTYTYLESRKISRETIDYADVRQDAHGNIVFNFYDQNDVLTMIKYKPSHKIDKTKKEPKTWCQNGADTTPLLFNMNRVNFEQPLLITEGEPDTLAAIEAGYKNTVSVPFGANNYAWIEENWEWLEQFDSIIVAMDNDEAGIKAQKEIIYRLGSWRTKIMLIPEYIEREDGRKQRIKDVNELLYFKGKEAVLDAIVNAKDTPVSSVIDFSEIEDLDMYDIDGVETGFKELDKELIKIFYGTLTILSGTPSSGKSSFINQLIANAIDKDIGTFLYSKEMPERITSNWIMLSFAGSRHIKEYQTPNGKSYYKVPIPIKNSIKDWSKGKLFIYKDDQPNELEDIKQSITDCVRKYGVHLIVIDNLMMLNMNSNEDNKYEKQTELINWLISFASRYNVAIILVAHPRKMADVTADVGMYEISGSSNIINLAHRSIGLRRISKKEKNDPRNKYHNYDVLMTVIKDRYLGKNEYQLGFHYDFMSRRFYTDYGEYAKQFGWDKNTYEKPLPIPECLIDKAEELYGGKEE